MGRHQGITADYVRILNERLGLNMKIVQNLSWAQVIAAALQKGVDVLPGVVKMPEREKYLNYAEPFIYIDWVIVSHKETPKINSLSDLEGRLTAVSEGSSNQGRLKKQYPGIPLLLQAKTLDSLQSVNEGKAEAAVVELTAATLIMHSYNINSLKIDKHVFQKNDPISFAVRNDWPELVQILNKGLSSITPDERERIRYKWLAVAIEVGYTIKNVLLIVLSVIAVMGILLAFFLFWNRRLQKEIHEKIKAEQALETSNSLMKIGESIAQLGFFERNWQTGDGQWSEGFYRLLGLTKQEAISHGEFMKFIHENDRQRVSEHIQETLRTKTNMDIGFQLIQANGNIVNIHGMGINSYDKEGKPLITRGTFQDISEFKRAEKETKYLQNQLLQVQKMESIGNLAGGIAHDFNNILSSVIGFTELALDDVAKGTPQEDNLQEVYAGGKRARDLVKQILAFARQSDEERKPIQVGFIAKEVLKLIRSTIPTSIKIKKNIESDSQVMGNASQVHQLFMNLCTNAAHAMEDSGGILEIQLTDEKYKDSSATLLGLQAGNYVKIIVSDTGSGISPDIIGSIFEPYFTTKGVGEGTGMGLAMVHGIVETYGGKITVVSELGKGTAFSIYLPVTKKSESYRQSEKETLPSGTERILLVDDELPIVKMSSQVLQRLGYQVTTRTSSFEALELFRSKPDDFDLVITDMTMPNMTGDELAMELIALRSDIPVILCTGYSKKITDEKAAKIGIKVFAFKPVVKAELAKTVRNVLDEAKGTAQV